MSARRLTIRILLALVAVIGSSRCVFTGWAAYGYDHRHLSKQPNESQITILTAGTLHQNFDFLAVPNGSFHASPSVYNNVVYVGNNNGIFYAIYATGPLKGLRKWQYPPGALPAPIVDACGIIQQPLKLPPGQSNSTSGPGIASSAAIVFEIPGHAAAVVFGAPDPTSNNGDGRVWAVDADNGRCIWKSPVIAPAMGNSKIGYSSPAIGHGRAYIGVSARFPDSIHAQGQLFAINLADGTLDPNFSFTASPPPSGGGIWGSPALEPVNGNVVIVTGNSCHHFVPPPVACPGPPPLPDYTNSLLELEWQTGKVMRQVQPVHIDWDNDPDWAVPPIVGQTSCGLFALSTQKDGYLHAVDIGSPPAPNPACSYTDHDLECPKWSFPTAPNLPFMEDGHGDTPFHRSGALDGDWLYMTSGGYNLTEMPPSNIAGDLPAGRIRFDRLYSTDVCASEADRVRWVFTNSTGGKFGGVSTANHVIYVGTYTGTTHLYALADPSVVPAAQTVCSYPNLPPDATCTSANFKLVSSPTILKDITGISGGIRGIPAISNGQIFVATVGGHIYGFVP